MSSSVLYMSMSLDGYIAGPNDEPGNPGGDGFARLHEWFVTADGKFFRPSGPAGELFDEINASGAVLAGGVPRSRPITGRAIITASRSSCPATGRRIPRWRIIRW
jgi:dihydrofolate reductase